MSFLITKCLVLLPNHRLCQQMNHFAYYKEPCSIFFDKKLNALTQKDTNKVIRPIYDPNDNFFKFSDKQTSELLPPINFLFPGANAGGMSKEMENMYIFGRITGVFKETFKEQFMETFPDYDFLNWVDKEYAFGLDQNWKALVTEWISESQIGNNFLNSGCAKNQMILRIFKLG